MIHPPLAHNPSALMNTAGILLIFGLLMVPLSYGCISLAGFVLGRIGAGAACCVPGYPRSSAACWFSYCSFLQEYVCSSAPVTLLPWSNRTGWYTAN